MAGMDNKNKIIFFYWGLDIRVIENVLPSCAIDSSVKILEAHI